MSYKKILLLLCITIYATMLSAQTKIVGQVVDSVTHESEPFVTIRIYKNNINSKPETMLISDDNGKFAKVIKGTGNYFIQLSAVGKKELIKQIKLQNHSKTTLINLGILPMQTAPEQIAGATITAQKPLVKMETDKMSYNIEADDEAKATTLLEMLRKVPMVTVDGQDNVKINGKESFKVYVDGKPNAMFSANASQIFKSMPASAVKRVEVITSPGAKYDAEGVAGILNIIMHEQNKTTGKNANGYRGSDMVAIHNVGYMFNLFHSGQQGKLSYSVNALHYQSYEIKGFKIITERQYNDLSKMIDEQNLSIKTPFYMGSVNLNYAINSASNIGATIGFSSFKQVLKGTPKTSFNGGRYGEGFSYSNYMESISKRTSANVSIDYQRFFNQAHTKSLVISYMLNTTPTENENNRTYENKPYNTSLSLNDLYSLANNNGTSHTVQADYTTPIVKEHTLNFGAKYIYHLNSSNAKYYDIVNLQRNLNKERSIDYDNQQNILAAYIEYAISKGKLGGRLGTRYEHTWANIVYANNKDKNYNKNYGNLVPSASISYSLKPTINIGMNYHWRISRPSISFLNPYRDQTNPTMIVYGNPNLEVENAHNLQMVFNNYSQKLTFNLTLAYDYAGNQIYNYSFLDKNNLLNSTYGNIVQRQQTSISTFVNYLLFSKTRLTLNASADYLDMRTIKTAQINQSNYGWQATAFLAMQQTLPKGFNLGASVGGLTKQLNLQGSSSAGLNMYSLQLSKNMLQDKLALSLVYRGTFDRNIKIIQYTKGANFQQTTTTSLPINYHLVFSVTWNFGNTNKIFKSHKTKIKNDFQEKEDDTKALPLGK